MKNRALLPRRFLWAALAGGGIAMTIVIACNSNSNPPGTGGVTAGCTVGKDTIACECENGQSGTQICGEPQTCTCNAASSSSGGSSSSGSSSGGVEDGGATDGGDGGDGATPFSLYAACAVTGSFGSPCTAATSGPDPTTCTDPNYPDCYVGGQGSWCSALCTPDDASTCLAAAADAGATGLDGGGCIPTACNALGYCK